jgi:hypothetical protein
MYNERAGIYMSLFIISWDLAEIDPVLTLMTAEILRQIIKAPAALAVEVFIIVGTMILWMTHLRRGPDCS